MHKRLMGLALVGMLAAGAQAADMKKMEAKKDMPANMGMQLMPASEVKWSPLDPANATGPQLSVLFGDPAVKGPIGVFLKIPAGTGPGPHIHTSDYYAVSVFGTEHNFPSKSMDKGKALPPGSWWYQAGGVGHNNFCEAGQDCVIFVYMPNGFDMAPDPAVAPAKK